MGARLFTDPRGRSERASVRSLVQISRLYWEAGLTQEAIACTLALSRPTVSRALDRARELGIVQIRVHDPERSTAALASAVARRFGLRDVVLADPESGGPGAVRAAVARAGAQYVQRRLRSGMVIGVTWGRTLHELVAALKPSDVEGLGVVQMLGGLGVVEEETTGLAEELARVLRARVVKLLAPAIVESEAARRAIAATTSVRQGLQYLRRIDMAVVGIGAVDEDVALVERRYVTSPFMRRMRRMGAVGEILVQFLDARGAIVRHPRCRVIGFPLAGLRRLPLAIGVAAGPPDKSEAVLAALRGRCLHVLVTDAATAQRVLDRAEGEARASASRGARRTARRPSSKGRSARSGSTARSARSGSIARRSR
jgi:DNA-binding transcriptional regulator LsrR (DeoR family)